MKDLENMMALELERIMLIKKTGFPLAVNVTILSIMIRIHVLQHEH